MRVAVVYCDGSGTTGGPAGIAYVAFVDDNGTQHHTENSLPLRDATNQQAEILAAALALHDLEPCDHITIYSDSEYLILGMTERLQRWINQDWKTNTGKPAANQNHWQRLLTAQARHHQTAWKWLKGHNNDPHNDRAHTLAQTARTTAQTHHTPSTHTPPPTPPTTQTAP